MSFFQEIANTIDKIFTLYHTQGMSETALEGGLTVPKKPDLDEISRGGQQAEANGSASSPIETIETKTPAWKKVLGNFFGDKTRAAITTAVIATGAGGGAHISTGGESTGAAQDIVASKVISPPAEFAQNVAGGILHPKFDNSLGIETSKPEAKGGTSVDAAKNVFGDGVGMVAGGINDAAEGVAGKIKDAGEDAAETVKDALFSEEAQEGWKERSLMGKPINDGEIIEAELIPVIDSKGNEMPIFVRTEPSQGGERKELKDVNIDPKKVKGIVVYGGHVGGESAVDGLELSTWLKMQGMENGKPIDVYVSGLTYKPLPKTSDQSR